MYRGRRAREWVGTTLKTHAGDNVAQKRTFNLHASAIRALDEMVAAGFAPSKNAMVERAIWQQFQEFRRHRRAEGWKAAASDALFLRDIAEVEQQFRTADRESLG